MRSAYPGLVGVVLIDVLSFFHFSSKRPRQIIAIDTFSFVVITWTFIALDFGYKHQMAKATYLDGPNLYHGALKVKRLNAPDFQPVAKPCINF